MYRNRLKVASLSSTLLTPSHTFDRAAIMRTAWTCARHSVVRNDAARRDKWWTPLSLREAFASALRRSWDLARGHRACEMHRIAQAAENARRATLPIVERRIVELTEARMLAVHIDSTREMFRTVAAIDAQLASLQVAA